VGDRDANGRIEVEWTERPVLSVIDDILHVNASALSTEGGRSNWSVGIVEDLQSNLLMELSIHDLGGNISTKSNVVERGWPTAATNPLNPGVRGKVTGLEDIVDYNFCYEAKVGILLTFEVSICLSLYSFFFPAPRDISVVLVVLTGGMQFLPDFTARRVGLCFLPTAHRIVFTRRLILVN